MALNAGSWVLAYCGFFSNKRKLRRRDGAAKLEIEEGM
jgi:hypothetical protein